MFSLIPLTIDDAEILEHLHGACFPDGWSQATFNNLLAERVTCGWMVKSQEATPLGFILARAMGNEAEILTFAVHPAHQNQGVGRYLLKELISFLRSVKCEKIYLEVATDNIKAISLYNSMSFQAVGSRPNYYRRDDNNFVSAVIMAYDFMG